MVLDFCLKKDPDAQLTGSGVRLISLQKVLNDPISSKCCTGKEIGRLYVVSRLLPTS